MLAITGRAGEPRAINPTRMASTKNPRAVRCMRRNAENPEQDQCRPTGTKIRVPAQVRLCLITGVADVEGWNRRELCSINLNVNDIYF